MPKNEVQMRMVPKSDWCLRISPAGGTSMAVSAAGAVFGLPVLPLGLRVTPLQGWRRPLSRARRAAGELLLCTAALLHVPIEETIGEQKKGQKTGGREAKLKRGGDAGVTVTLIKGGIGYDVAFSWPAPSPTGDVPSEPSASRCRRPRTASGRTSPGSICRPGSCSTCSSG